MGPRGLIGWIYVGANRLWVGLQYVIVVFLGHTHFLLHTKYISCGPHGFREEFSHHKCMETLDTRNMASLTYIGYN